jgi:hypothetical protein
MIARRELLSGSALGGWLGGARAAAGADPAPQDRIDLGGVVKSLEALRGELAQIRNSPEIADVREQQKQFLRQAGKLPDFIEVGVDIWFDAYDWHVRNQLPPAVGRDAAGRYTISLLDTVLIMRADLPSARFIGVPYDNR